jgi:hypothetical protein
MRADEILSWQRLRLEKVDSSAGSSLARRDGAACARCAHCGAEQGSLAAELSDTDDKARASLSRTSTKRQTCSAGRSSGYATTASSSPTSTESLRRAYLRRWKAATCSRRRRATWAQQSALNMAIGHVASFRLDGSPGAGYFSQPTRAASVLASLAGRGYRLGDLLPPLFPVVRGCGGCPALTR